MLGRRLDWLLYKLFYEVKLYQIAVPAWQSRVAHASHVLLSDAVPLLLIHGHSVLLMLDHWHAVADTLSYACTPPCCRLSIHYMYFDTVVLPCSLTSGSDVPTPTKQRAVSTTGRKSSLWLQPLLGHSRFQHPMSLLLSMLGSQLLSRVSIVPAHSMRFCSITQLRRALVLKVSCTTRASTL